LKSASHLHGDLEKIVFNYHTDKLIGRDGIYAHGIYRKRDRNLNDRPDY